MRKKSYKYFVGDFETSVYDGQINTEVWASAVVEMYTDDVKIFGSIRETLNHYKSFKKNVIAYYHNLKFDGEFWISYLLNEMNYNLAITGEGSNRTWKKDKDMFNGEFKCMISDKGAWYSTTIKTNNIIIEFRDSMKLLPYSVKRIGESFGTAHKKLDMEYKGFRYAGCHITDEEKEYIRNDVLVVKEALEIMFDAGHDKLTIGSCCLEEFKKSIGGKEDFNLFFPDTETMELPESFGSLNVEKYVRKSYRGGWVYVVKGKDSVIYKNGVTLDVNSLYPSVMHSCSGNRYPVGYPFTWTGDYIPDKARENGRYYFVRFKTRFYLKNGFLPFVQIKNSPLYNGRENLATSDYKGKDGRYYSKMEDENGVIKPVTVELTMTQTDFKLFKEHYTLKDFEILDGMYFNTEIGLFDKYMDKYMEIKSTSKGAKRESAKLFMNNLYGKKATSTDSSFKVPYIKQGKIIAYEVVKEYGKKSGYIPIGSAITSYAREFTIRVAQQNFHGVDKAGFIYADTDSIHCDISIEKIKGATLHNSNFCCWKNEGKWDTAVFVRAKTYIEHMVTDGVKDIEPYYLIKCAGMPDKCKNLFKMSFDGYTPEDFEKLNDEEKEFVSVKRELSDFNIGLRVPSKLRPKRIDGGLLLEDSVYTMH